MTTPDNQDYIVVAKRVTETLTYYPSTQAKQVKASAWVLVAFLWLIWGFSSLFTGGFAGCLLFIPFVVASVIIPCVMQEPYDGLSFSERLSKFGNQKY